MDPMLVYQTFQDSSLTDVSRYRHLDGVVYTEFSVLLHYDAPFSCSLQGTEQFQSICAGFFSYEAITELGQRHPHDATRKSLQPLKCLQ